MSDAWAVVAAALGSAFLTVIGTFWLERWRADRAAHAATSDRLREACVQMASHAQSLAFRAKALYLTTVLRSGIGEGLDIALYYRKPLDPMQLSDWLSLDITPILQAQIVVEVAGDRELMQGAADLVLAASEVLGKATAVRTPGADPTLGQLRRFVRGLLPVRRDPEVEDAVQHAVRQLGQQQRRFARLTRDRLGVNDPDAVIQAFPELFSEAGTVPHEEPETGKT